MRLVFCILLLNGCASILFCQRVEIQDSSGEVAAYFDGDVLIDASTKQPFVTVKGNIIFDGASDKKKDILLLIRSENIFAKKKEGSILNSKQTEILFTTYNGGFVYRDKGIYNYIWLLARYESEDDQPLTLYQDTSDVVLCRIPNNDLPTGKLVAVFYFFVKKFGLEDSKEEKEREIKESIIPGDVSNTSGTIRKLWNTGYDEFEWDGEILKRKWNSFDYEEWTFDGTTLKRLWFPGDEEFVWDGRVLKRKWFSSQDEFEWDGTVLRRRWGSNDEFIIQGNMIKRYFNSNSNDEWTIDGEVPIPIIALIIFGLLRK